MDFSSVDEKIKIKNFSRALWTSWVERLVEKHYSLYNNILCMPYY